MESNNSSYSSSGAEFFVLRDGECEFHDAVLSLDYIPVDFSMVNFERTMLRVNLFLGYLVPCHFDTMELISRIFFVFIYLLLKYYYL
jgi:hypothetical protein